MKYTNGSIVVEAIQFIVTKEIPCKYGIHKETNSGEIAEFLGEPIRVSIIPDGTKEGRTCITDFKETIELNIGDYIVKDSSGHFYACKANEFKFTKL